MQYYVQNTDVWLLCEAWPARRLVGQLTTSNLGRFIDSDMIGRQSTFPIRGSHCFIDFGSERSNIGFVNQRANILLKESLLFFHIFGDHGQEYPVDVSQVLCRATGVYLTKLQWWVGVISNYVSSHKALREVKDYWKVAKFECGDGFMIAVRDDFLNTNKWVYDGLKIIAIITGCNV